MQKSTQKINSKSRKLIIILGAPAALATIAYCAYFFYLGKITTSKDHDRSVAAMRAAQTVLDAITDSSPDFRVRGASIEGASGCSFLRFEVLRKKCIIVPIIIPEDAVTEKYSLTKLHTIARRVGADIYEACNTSSTNHSEEAAEVRVAYGCDKNSKPYSIYVQIGASSKLRIGEDGATKSAVRHIHTHKVQGAM
jgi:hypothetical protein